MSVNNKDIQMYLGSYFSKDCTNQCLLLCNNKAMASGCVHWPVIVCFHVYRALLKSISFLLMQSSL